MYFLFTEHQSIILDFKHKNGPVVKKKTSTAPKLSYVGKEVAPECTQRSWYEAGSLYGNQEIESLEEREAILTNDITKNLVKLLFKVNRSTYDI